MSICKIRTIDKKDIEAVRILLRTYWGSPIIVTRGKKHNADNLPGFAAFENEKMIGLITCNIKNNECGIISLNRLRERIGIGTALIEAARDMAIRADCRRLWLISTNDNIPAIEFYKRRGFKIAAVHKGAMVESRKLKPEIPLYGIDGVPITDEVEMEMRVG